MKRNSLLAILATSALLLGCASKPEVKTEVVTKYETIEKPVMTPCEVPHIAEPVDLIADLKPSDDLFYKVKVILADRENHNGYEKTLKAAIESCNRKN